MGRCPKRIQAPPSLWQTSTLCEMLISTTRLYWGPSIQKGMWLPSFTNMTARFENTLANKPVYLFLMCIVALEQTASTTPARTT